MHLFVRVLHTVWMSLLCDRCFVNTCPLSTASTPLPSFQSREPQCGLGRGARLLASSQLLAQGSIAREAPSLPQITLSFLNF